MKRVKYYKRFIKYYIEEAFLELNDSNPACISKHIVNKFKNQYISENDLKLINIALKNDVSQKEFDDFIRNWDIEKEGGHKALLLSFFMKNHPEIQIPKYAEPRLKGLLQYFRFRNMNLIAHFKKICSRLKQNSIPVLIIKGAAMRHYRQDIPRLMGDIDVLVIDKNLQKSKNIVKDLGYTYIEYPHSIDLHIGENNEGIVDIHSQMDLMSEKQTLINQDIFSRAHLDKVFGIENIFVPSIEDMLFISLINMVKNLIRRTSIASILYTVFDCKYLIESKPDFNWEIIKQNTTKTETAPLIYIAIKFIKELAQINIPDMFEEEFNSYTTKFIYNKYLLPRMKEKSHSIKINDIFFNFNNFNNFIQLKSKYFLYKRRLIRNNIKLSNNIIQNNKELIRENIV